jgi:uncharacterized XkdX family phage protein
MSKFAERVKGYYTNGYYTETMVRNLATKGKLTEEEVAEILAIDKGGE